MSSSFTLPLAPFTLRVLLLSTFPCVLMSAAAASPWPELMHPRDARIEPIGEQVRLNGVPMRIARVLSPAPTAVVLSHYQQVLGAQVAHARTGHAHVLAQARGDFFITVTITPQPDGNTEALSSIADSRAAREASSQPLGFNLPAGSELLSDMESVDGPLTSRQLVLINAHALRLNLSQLSASLAARGLHPAGPPLADSADALVQAFGGASGEAQLVLVRGEGTTHAILTLLSRRP